MEESVEKMVKVGSKDASRSSTVFEAFMSVCASSYGNWDGATMACSPLSGNVDHPRLARSLLPDSCYRLEVGHGVATLLRYFILVKCPLHW